MMNWKDTIILGSIAGSGKFKLILDEYAENYEQGDKTYGVTKFEVHGNGVVRLEKWFNSSNIQDCKLIARPMSDMSDEEDKACKELCLKVGFEENYELEHTPESYLYLLSIGVLPESLADEDVIWRNENG